MKSLPPIFLVDLLPELDDRLIALLRSLSFEDWHRPTLAPDWRVKDIATHLLDGNLRTLSMLRDDYYGESPDGVEDYEGMVRYLNQLNADWVKATNRLSPEVLIVLLEHSGEEYGRYLKGLDPHEKAQFSVGWAGEEESQNWFHIAREYTEKWHHQQQIRSAVGKSDELMSDRYFMPYLDTSVRALPHHYRYVSGIDGDCIRFVFQGVRDYVYHLYWSEDRWHLTQNFQGPSTTEVHISGDIIWKVLTKGMRGDVALEQSEIHGNRELGSKIFEVIAIMG